MIGGVITVLLIILLLVRLYKDAYKKPVENFPPGPPSLPIWGAYFIIILKELNNLGGAMRKLADEYKTKVVGMYLGAFPSVVVDDPTLIKEVLNREEFDGRMDIIVGRLRGFWKRLGIFFTDDYFWHVQRRFSLRYMRDYGFGRRCGTLESVVDQEIKEMIDMVTSGPKYPIEKEIVKGDLILLPEFFVVPFLNGLLHVFGRMTLPRSEYHTLWHLARRATVFQSSSNDFGGALSLTPWLKEIIPKWSGFAGLKSGNEGIRDLMTKLVEEALATYEESHDRHFLDVYIRKMKDEIKSNKRTTFSVDQLVLICVDYAFPTATAVEHTLAFLVERVLLQPEIQDKLHEEIDRVVGRGRAPTLDDRHKMPYTEACIREMMRYEPLVPLGVPHRATTNTKLGGYNIPENTLVSVNYTSLHFDKGIWTDPENFRPERYIENGKLKVSNDKSLPFGAGRRLCAGETYARQTMFQVFAAFMQAFHISTADGHPLKKPLPRRQGIIMMIQNFWIRVKPRT
ncbi:probable cytochrome P450 304a1 [Epargyreus clarus]|uniref:probable cytochrome P450 304a1 n=1 Tax=Epargyreus clarus TaxID=520877 RepID=UPI003C2FF2E9